MGVNKTASKCSLFLLIISMFVSPGFTDSCSSNLSESTCTSNNGCSWTESTTSTCVQQQYNCENQNQVDCSGNTLSGACNWNPPVEGVCAIKASACVVLNKADNSCSNPNSCQVNIVAYTQCDVLSDQFGCENLTAEATCTNAAQCSWSTTPCNTNFKCETLYQADCTNPACQIQPQNCSVTPEAQSICSAITNANACSQRGCYYDTNKKTCNQPQFSQCYVQGSSCNSDLCYLQFGACVSKPNACTSASTQATCDSTYCAWSENYPKCVNNNQYCGINSQCQNKGQYCSSSSAQYSKCVPIPSSKTCSSLSQADCSADNVKDLCEFQPGTEGYCSNKNGSCTLFTGDDTCSSQSPPCKWTSTKSMICTTKVQPTPQPQPTPTTSFGSLLHSGIGLFEMCTLIIPLLLWQVGSLFD